MSARVWVLAEYHDEQALYAAARALREAGHTTLDLYSPYPLHGSDEALGLRRSPVPLIALVGGVIGIASALLMQWWMNAVDFPINVGNRTLIPYPAMVPITFELGVLFSALAIFFGVLGICGYPRTWHPVFEVEAFRSAAVDALWLGARVNAEEAQGVAEELRRLGAAQVSTTGEDA